MAGSSKFERYRDRTIELRGSAVRTGIEPVKQGVSLNSLARKVLSSQFDSNSVSNEPRTDQFDEGEKMTPSVRTSPAAIQEEKLPTLGTSKTIEADIANFYRKLFHSQAPIATVILDGRAVGEAMRLGLLDGAKHQVILAYRNLQA